MRKILVLIDGYNFYHKLREFQHRFNRCVKWLNYKELIKCYFNDYDNFEFEYIYFSAIAEFKGMKQRTVYNSKRGEYIEDYPSWFYCGTGGYSDCNPFAWTYLPDYNELFEIFK